MSKNQKLTTDELKSLRTALSEFNQMKVQLANNVLQQKGLIEAIDQVKDTYMHEEKKILDKYGSNARINLETGEITDKLETNA